MPTLKYQTEVNFAEETVRAIATNEDEYSADLVAACKAWVADNPEMVRLRGVADIGAVRLASDCGFVTACVTVKGYQYFGNGVTPERALTDLLELMVPRD